MAGATIIFAISGPIGFAGLAVASGLGAAGPWIGCLVGQKIYNICHTNN